MRRLITFPCDGVTLAGTLDPGASETGLLIVSGGNEIRTGAHRGMARLACDIAKAGHPVMRFDRRGIGDSAGENHGFTASGPDIAAALAAFRQVQPQLTRIVAFGNCDAATALVIHRHDTAIDALVLANPWIIEPQDDLPPQAAIKDRYARRLRDPAAWAALLTGKVDMRALARGLGRLATPSKPADLATAFATALGVSPLPTTIMLAARDGTALAFADAWKGAAFAAVRDTITLHSFDSASHSFASDTDYALLHDTVLAALSSR
jgi:exosortase A-associated hydrolase 1